ncbi:hypothetical protein HSB1_30240 [Halogranum salarium B-1]|uniref:Uncharacterized protein n=1 Tax=Halogranum salarium B-1 TaxID=1210908 RepID=J3JEP4_9EURY|nr:hypothetical protein HSB1_30240 [Halogranum salarium B-1]
MGLKGDALSTNPDEVSTGTNEVSEEHSETRESRVRGLSRSLTQYRSRKETHIHLIAHS